MGGFGVPQVPRRGGSERPSPPAPPNPRHHFPWLPAPRPSLLPPTASFCKLSQGVGQAARWTPEAEQMLEPKATRGPPMTLPKPPEDLEDLPKTPADLSRTLQDL